jgi:CheY-like chemotaxis protein
MSVSARSLKILLVEDSPGDVRLTREALAEGDAVSELHVADDGEQAMDFLRRRGAHKGAPRPDLVLLDLNLPRLDGREVLEEMKGDADLRRIPVVVMTTSTSDEDVLRSYDLHANSYVSKPLELDEFMRAVQAVEGFWRTVASLPPE